MMLSIKNLNKRYGRFQAVSELNLEVAEGEIFGFVGPNGAGKTTTMKIICVLLRATSGEITLDGVDIIQNSRRMKEKIGYMPDFFGVYDDLKVSEYLEFYASIYNIKGQERKRITDDLLDITGSAESLGKTPGKDQASNKATWISVFGEGGARKKLKDMEAEGIQLIKESSLDNPISPTLTSLLQYSINREK